MALVMNLSHQNDTEAAFDNQQINHFSHRHPLQPCHLHHTDTAVCSGCELDIIGSAYTCTKPTCTFVLHDLCLDLPRRIRHHCHPNHNLTLLPAPPYSDGEFTCDACGSSGHGFTYNCGGCKFDLHIGCASLPETEKRWDHQHPLMLVSAFSEKMESCDFVCYVCDDPVVVKGPWMYCCLACKCGTHLECAHK